MNVYVCVSGRRYPESVSVHIAVVVVVVLKRVQKERVSGKAIDFSSSVCDRLE